jgi:hypothetical protein
MIRVSKGVSRHGSGDSPKPGSTWVHHNVIDTSQMMQYGRERSPGVWPKECDSGMQGKVWARPFGTHTGSGFGNGDAWRIYHNTLVFGKDLNLYGAGHTVSSRPGYRHEVLNNIFVQIGDHAVARQATSVGGYQVYDGNLYHQRSASSSTPLFRNYVSDSSTDLALLAQEKFGCSKGQPCWDATCAQVDVNGDGRVGTEDIVALFRSPASEQKTSFMSLAEFLRSPFHQGTRAFYAQGWEANSVEADPKLDSQYAPSASGPGASGAVPLPAGYRGDQSERHRGALAPGHTLSEVGPYP